MSAFEQIMTAVYELYSQERCVRGAYIKSGNIMIAAKTDPLEEFAIFCSDYGLAKLRSGTKEYALFCVKFNNEYLHRQVWEEIRVLEAARNQSEYGRWLMPDDADSTTSEFNNEADASPEDAWKASLGIDFEELGLDFDTGGWVPDDPDAWRQNGPS